MVAVDQNLSGLISSPQACAYNPPPTTRSDLSAVSLPSTNTPSNLSAPLPSTAPSFATPSELPSTAPLSQQTQYEGSINYQHGAQSSETQAFVSACLCKLEMDLKVQ